MLSTCSFFMITKNKILPALIANSIPIIGVLFWHWSAISILLAYWLENFVIGFFTILKMRRAKKNFAVNDQNKLVTGPLRIVTNLEHTAVPIIFVIHYSVFMWGHFGLLGIIASYAHEPLVFNYAILVTIFPLLYTHYLEYRDNYVIPKAYEFVPLTKLMLSPYRRIFVMHLTIILGSFPIMWFANYFPQITIVLVLLKIFFDLKFQDAEAKAWARFNSLPTIEFKK